MWGGREFVALDPEQERLRMEFAVSGLRYAYRSGETVSDPAKGCDLSDATVALACAYGIGEAVLAKREISRLWEDTSKAPYKALFNSSVPGSRVWITVELMRWVDRALEDARPLYDGRDRLIAVHGNRLVLWSVMRHLKVGSVDASEAFVNPFKMVDVWNLAGRATRLLVRLANEAYPDSYPQPLFKNQSKCRDIGDQLLQQLAVAI